MQKRSGPPKTLYLYLGAPDPFKPQSTDDLLRKRRFKLSRPDSLNDPFDLLPSFHRDAKPEEIREYLERWYLRRAILRKVSPRDVADFKARWDERLKDAANWWKEINQKNIRLVCFSKRRDGILLWAHYAQSHLGFAVGFRTDRIFSQVKYPEVFAGLVQVDYLPERIRFHLRNLIPSDDSTMLFHRFYGRKSREWKYEQEWRALFRRKLLVNDTYLSFPADAVSEIILGSGIDLKHEQTLKQACVEGGLPFNLKVSRAKLSEDRFKILIEKSVWR